ncbi:MAG: thioredoxin-dependent thiol peroxidase [Candidatus Micrarchaeia archaeon]
MASLKIGDKAPEFDLPDAKGTTHLLSDYLGKSVILYFYPKDDTPGCTTEACSFRDDSSKFSKAGYTIIGISPDDSASHTAFAKKYSLKFTLLADADHAVAEKYGVWCEKQYMNRKYMGICRTTFVIDENGIIKRIFENVRPEGHSKELLELIGAKG